MSNNFHQIGAMEREQIHTVTCFFWLCTVWSFLGAWQDDCGWLQLAVGQPVHRWQLDQYILESSTTRSTTEPKQVSYDVVTSIVSCQTGYQYILENCRLQLEPHSLHKKEHMGGRQTEDQYILDPGRKEPSTQTDDSFSVFGFLRDTEGGCVAPFSAHHYAMHHIV